MKIKYLILVALLYYSCATTEHPKTIVTFNPDGTSTVITKYKDSVKMVLLNKDGERIDNNTDEEVRSGNNNK